VDSLYFIEQMKSMTIDCIIVCGLLTHQQVVPLPDGEVISMALLCIFETDFAELNFLPLMHRLFGYSSLMCLYVQS